MVDTPTRRAVLGVGAFAAGRCSHRRQHRAGAAVANARMPRRRRSNVRRQTEGRSSNRPRPSGSICS